MSYSRKLVLTIASFFFATILVAQVTAFVEPDTGFEIEGNIAFDGDGVFDWENAPYPPAVLIVDPHSKSATDTNIFKPNGKFEAHLDWSIQPGSVGSAQSELTNIFVWAIPPGDLDPLGGFGPVDSWLVLGMERTKKEGTFALDFELNQVPWDGASGTLVRTPGDISVGFELKGNPRDPQTDLQVLIVVYDPFLELDNNQCEVTIGKGHKLLSVRRGLDPCPAYGAAGWFYRFLDNAAVLDADGYGVATMNPAGFSEADGAPAGYVSYSAQGQPDGFIGPFEFAEAAINLSALDLDPGCPGFGSVHAKTRSSLEVGSDLKDLAGPEPLPVKCELGGCKYLDIDASGTRGDTEPGLSGWTINLSGTTSGGDPVSLTATTDDDGCYLFENLANGSYDVSEVCPAGEGWVQTDPGSAASCGDEIHSGIVVDLDNRIVSDVDFGNGQPDIAITKTCTANVFVGDDISYTITVENTGNVNLTDVNVVDTLLGPFGPVDLTPGGTHDFAAVLTTTAAGAVDNTATAEGDYALATVSDSADCTSTVWGLTVSKTASTSFTRTYEWNIDKVVDDPGPIVVPGGGSVEVNYTVTVDTVGFTDSDWAVEGSITIANPAPIDAALASVSDVVSLAIAASVQCPSLTVPAGGSLSCTYSTPLPDASNRLNTATATLSNNNGGTTDFTGMEVVTFASAAIDEIDECVDVTDTNPEFAAVFGTPQVCADAAPGVFTYARTLTTPAGVCGDVTFDNTATFETNDTQTTGSDDASVTLTAPCEGCTPGFWQGGAGSQLWNVPNDPDWPASGGDGTNPYIHMTPFNSFFAPVALLDGFSMFDLVSTGGGSLDQQKAARDTVAACLNAQWGMGFPYGSCGEIQALWAGAVASGNLAALHNLLASANDPKPDGLCPIGGSGL
jgi:hypothetical protein